MSFTTTASKVIEGAIGLYLFLPGIEDAATGGTTLIPSAAVGAAMLLHAFGVDFGKVFK